VNSAGIERIAACVWSITYNGFFIFGSTKSFPCIPGYSRNLLPAFQCNPHTLHRSSVFEPNQVWVADITYIPTNEGWLYLVDIKDLCTGEIVGQAMAERMTQELVGKALFRAVARKKPPTGLIHHSIRGSQYCSRRYQKLLVQFGMIPSMSRKGTATKTRQWKTSSEFLSQN
jgi:transposase InsO family protein